MVSCSVAAVTQEINDAVNRYYAGFPEEAISMMKPLALAGDVDAQYLLGNILYSLPGPEKSKFIDEAVRWYKMAAEQNSADANYALGVIFQNKWVNARSKKDAARAIVYYQKAVDLGNTKAQAHLTRIKSRTRISQQEAVALAKEQQAMPVLKSETGVEAFAKDEDNMESVTTLTSADSSVSINIASNSGAVEEPGEIAENSDQSARIVDVPDDKNTVTVTLDDIANQCQNYTETGFALYAETIVGALFSGNATMTAMSPDSSEPGTFSIDLTNKRLESAVNINLRKVPEEVAGKFEKGKKIGITGIVTNSRVVGSNCTVGLIYQSATG